jgi:hypothetical protein
MASMMSHDPKSRVVDFLDVTIPESVVLRRLGYPSGQTVPNGHVGSLFHQAVRDAPEFIQPKGVYRLLSIASRSESVTEFRDTDFVLQSKQVTKMLRNAEMAVVFMVTIGSALEDHVKQLMDTGEMTQGVILDAIGSETADAAADKLHHGVIKELALESKYSITPRFSPGYGDWLLTVQKEILSLCSGSQIGISVNDSFLMRPRKSVSAVLGWTPNRGVKQP